MQRVKIEEPQHQLKGNTSLKAGLTLVVVVENGEVAPDVVRAKIVKDEVEEDIALTPHPTGRDADGRMLFLAPDAGKALLLVLRYSFEAGGGASFTPSPNLHPGVARSDTSGDPKRTSQIVFP